MDRLGREAVKACLHKAQGLRAIGVQHLGPDGFLQYYGLQSARNSFTVVLAARCCARLKQNCIRLKQEASTWSRVESTGKWGGEQVGVESGVERGMSWSGTTPLGWQRPQHQLPSHRPATRGEPLSHQPIVAQEPLCDQPLEEQDPLSRRPLVAASGRNIACTAR